MGKRVNKISRRALLVSAASGMASAAAGVEPTKAPKTKAPKTKAPMRLPTPQSNVNPDELARDEGYWRNIRKYYDSTVGVTNLEHGYWGKMAHPVQEFYQSATRMVNAQNSFYVRKDYDADYQYSVQRVAHSLGVDEEEIVLTRNATEAIHCLIRQYTGLKSGDAVLYADVDYPNYKSTMRWLQTERNVEVLEIKLPELANQQELLSNYLRVFDASPNLKLMLLTHVSNQHGMIVPVKQIAAAARERGIDVICDCAQSWGLLDYKMQDLQVDWAGFNLHKWIGAPVGIGALYMRRGSLHRIAPYPGKVDEENNNISTRVHIATSNFAAMLSVPAALDFHELIGGKNKNARLNYLRSLWTTEAQKMPVMELLGGSDEASRTGMASFRLRGKKTIDDANQLQQILEQDFGVFTVIRKGLASGSCVRVTPQVFNTPEQIAQLVVALRQLS